MATNEITGLCRIEYDHLQGCRAPKTNKTFRRGDVILREKPFVECPVDRDDARLLSVLELKADVRAEFTKLFTDYELKQRGMELDEMDLTPFLEMAENFHEQTGSQIDVTGKEVASILCRWDLAQHLSKIRMYRHISKLPHSCNGDAIYEHNLNTGLGVITANSDIQPATRIGVWALEDLELWWKGANIRSDALKGAGIFQSECMCDRCAGPDQCRALACPGCGDGAICRWGKEKRWKCVLCDFEGSDTAVGGILGIEEGLIEEIGDTKHIAKTELEQMSNTVSERLGPRHWLVALVRKETYRRNSRVDTNFPGALAGLQFIEWINDRQEYGT